MCHALLLHVVLKFSIPLVVFSRSRWVAYCYQCFVRKNTYEQLQAKCQLYTGAPHFTFALGPMNSLGRATFRYLTVKVSLNTIKLKLYTIANTL